MGMSTIRRRQSSDKGGRCEERNSTPSPSCEFSNSTFASSCTSTFVSSSTFPYSSSSSSASSPSSSSSSPPSSSSPSSPPSSSSSSSFSSFSSYSSFSSSSRLDSRDGEEASESANLRFVAKQGVFRSLQMFYSLASPYFRRERTAQLKLLSVLLLSLLSSGLSVMFSYLGRDFWNALSSRDVEAFWYQLGKFLVLMTVAVPIIVAARFMRDTFSVEWREWLTEQILKDYLENRAYYQLDVQKTIDNPDQRIAEDIRSFTTISLRFLLTVLGTALDLASFTFVLMSIDASLLLAAGIYSGVGTFLTIRIGSKLVGLSFEQLQREADLRYSLVRVAENAESVAFYGGERFEMYEVQRRVRRIIQNAMSVIRVERYLELFTSSYRYLIQILPAAVVAPQYFAGAIPLGVVSQSYGAFNHILGDLSIIVTQFEHLSAFSAGLDRLGQFVEALQECRRQAEERRLSFLKPPFVDADDQEKAKTTKKKEKMKNFIDGFVVPKRMLQRQKMKNEEDKKISEKEPLLPSPYFVILTEIISGAKTCLLDVEGITVKTPDSIQKLISGLSFSLSPYDRLLIVGGSGSGKSSLLRAIAGLWEKGEGFIRRPPSRETFFLPQKPYCCLGTLREQLLYPHLSPLISSFSASCISSSTAASKHEMPPSTPSLPSDEELLEILERVHLGSLPLQLEAARFLEVWKDPASASSPLSSVCRSNCLSSSLPSLNPSSSSVLPSSSESPSSPFNVLDCVRDWSDMLSLGEQQRLAFGRILVHRPRVVFLDESTSALDIETEKLMYTEILMGAKEMEGVCFVSVGHRPSLVKFHSRQLKLLGGGKFELTDIPPGTEEKEG